MVYCNTTGGFVATREKLHPAFDDFDAEEKCRFNSTQRSRAVCWTLEGEADVDSDTEDDSDEEAEALARFLSVTGTHARA